MVVTSAMALILSATLLDRTTTLWSLRSLVSRSAHSRTRSSGFGETASASSKPLGENRPLGEISAIGLKEPEPTLISSSMRCAEGVEGGVGAMGSISDELWMRIHPLSVAMHSSIHWSVEVALVDRLNRPSRCFMESSSLFTVGRIETTLVLKAVQTAQAMRLATTSSTLSTG